MQTFNYPPKNKDVQATALKFANGECMVNQWSIYDAYENSNVSAEAEEGAEVNKDADDALPGLSIIDPISSKIANSNSTIGEQSSAQYIAANDEVANSIIESSRTDNRLSIAGTGEYNSGILPEKAVASSQHQENEKTLIERELLFNSVS